MTSLHSPSPPTPPRASRPLSAPPQIYPPVRSLNYPALPYPPPPPAYDTDESSNFGDYTCDWSNSGDSEDSIFLPDDEFILVNAMRTLSAWQEGTGFGAMECLLPKIVVEDVDDQGAEERAMGVEGKKEAGKKGKKARKKEMKKEIMKQKLKRAKPIDFGDGEFIVLASGVEDGEAEEKHVRGTIQEGLNKGKKKKKKAEKKKAKLEQKAKEKEKEKDAEKRKGKKQEKEKRQHFEEENVEEKTTLQFDNQECLLVDLEQGGEKTRAEEEWKGNGEAATEMEAEGTKEEKKQKKKAAKKAKAKEKKEKKKSKLNFSAPEGLLVGLTGEDAVVKESIPGVVMEDAGKVVKKKNSAGSRF